MKSIQTIDELVVVLESLLADKPKGTVGLLPGGDTFWVLDGQVIGCWDGGVSDDDFKWDQKTLSLMLEDVNDWLAAPAFDCHVPDADYDGDLSLTAFRPSRRSPGMF